MSRLVMFLNRTKMHRNVQIESCLVWVIQGDNGLYANIHRLTKRADSPPVRFHFGLNNIEN